MKKSMKKSRLGAALLGLALWLLLPFSAGAQPSESDGQTRQIMDQIVQALQVVLPPSLNAEKFQDSKHRSEILAALQQLSDNASLLEEHGSGGDASFDFLSGSLADDAREIRLRYADGRFSQARFLLHHVTEVCVACHSRLPDDQVRTLGRRLMADDAVSSLPVSERVQFEVATRQFDAAEQSYESLFLDPSVAPRDVDLTGPYEGYLELCLRVKDDPARAAATLEKISQRDDLSEYVRANLKAWTASLRELSAEPMSGNPLVQARALVAQAEDRERFSDDRKALVPFIAASGALHRYVAAQTGPSRDLGEAYYLLGVIEAQIGRTFWASQTENFLEAAIRMSPAEPYAEQAFALLEEFIVAGYSGSGGEHVPPDVRKRLADLRELIDRAEAS